MTLTNVPVAPRSAGRQWQDNQCSRVREFRAPIDEVSVVVRGRRGGRREDGEGMTLVGSPRARAAAKRDGEPSRTLHTSL